MTSRPADHMRDLGIVQRSDPRLTRPARPFDFPTEGETAAQVIDQLFATAERVARVHRFAKGMGIAAPQIGIDRAAAIVRPPHPGAAPIVLLNPVITDASAEADEQYEGCLSFFDVRGLAIRPLRITVRTTTREGRDSTAVYERGLARLVAHEIDHLDGILYTARTPAGARPISLDAYRQTGANWTYGS